MHRLSRRIRELEKRSGADGRLVSIALGDEPGQAVNIPASFAEWLTGKEQEHCSGGRCLNLTDGRWEEC